MATIYDVAKKAGVSIAAVSLVINNSETPRVGAEKRKHILSVARALQYAPNGLAKALSHGSTQILGLVVPMKDPIFFNNFIAEVLSGIQSSLMVRGYHLMIYTHSAKSGRITQSELTQSRYVDGIIVLNTRMCSRADIEGSIDDLDRARIPFVMTNCYSARQGINYVGVDDYYVGRVAANYLCGKGQIKIAVISGASRSPMSAQLLSGFKAGLKPHAGKLPAAWHCYSEYDPATIGSFINGIFANRSRPAAIFCADDQLVPEIYKALGQLNLRIPDDVSVLGRGNLPLGTALNPLLSTIEVPAFEMGRQAADLLLDVVQAKIIAPRKLLLESALIRRESA